MHVPARLVNIAAFQVINVRRLSWNVPLDQHWTFAPIISGVANYFFRYFGVPNCQTTCCVSSAKIGGYGKRKTPGWVTYSSFAWLERNIELAPRAPATCSRWKRTTRRDGSKKKSYCNATRRDTRLKETRRGGLTFAWRIGLFVPVYTYVCTYTLKHTVRYRFAALKAARQRKIQ